MLAVLIFDQVNDVVYLRCDHKFVCHVRSMAVSQGLLHQTEVDPDQVTTVYIVYMSSILLYSCLQECILFSSFFFFCLYYNIN